MSHFQVEMQLRCNIIQPKCGHSMTYLFLETLPILILCVDKIPPKIYIQWISIIFVWNPM
jgi:hypothetical protein